MDHLERTGRVGQLFTGIRQIWRHLIAERDILALRTVTFITAINHTAATVLNTINQGRGDFLAAIDQFGIGRGQTHHCRFRCTKRHGKNFWQFIDNPETFGVIGNHRHANGLGQTNGHKVSRFFNPKAHGRGTIELAAVVARLPLSKPRPLINHERRIKNQC